MSLGPPPSVIHECPRCGGRCTCATGNAPDGDCLHCATVSDAFRTRLAEIAQTRDTPEKGDPAS